MPHVVLNGFVSLDDKFATFKGVFIRNENGIHKTDTMYISRDKTVSPIEALTIESGVKRSFFVLISRRNDGVVIRIYQSSEVEKTVGVKSILSEIAKQLLVAFP